MIGEKGKNTLEYNTKSKDILPGREGAAVGRIHLRTRIASGGWTQRKANLMMGLISMLWGSSFLMMKVGLDGIDPFFITAWRFGVAFFVLALLFYKMHFMSIARCSDMRRFWDWYCSACSVFCCTA